MTTPLENNARNASIPVYKVVEHLSPEDDKVAGDTSSSLHGIQPRTARCTEVRSILGRIAPRPCYCIEQVLTRSLKTAGGLTRGRGMTETQRPAYVVINSAMQQLTSVSYTTSEQHKDISQARQTRDTAGAPKFMSFIEWRSPFDTNPSLQNIVSGIIAGNNVNVHCAKEIGDAIINGMMGKGVLQYSFKRKDQAVTFDSKIVIKIGGEVVQIDPLLFIKGSSSQDLRQTILQILRNIL